MKKLILLILAAILVPSMLGYVRKSKEMNERIEARSQYEDDYLDDYDYDYDDYE